jgi:SulP family sulfate permease
MTDLQEALKLLPTAGLMALIVFVSSSSVASTYARLRGESFDANHELTGLGLANLSGGLFQSFAVAGGFSRTAINADSGANTPLASLVTVLVMIAALIAFSNALAPLPYALLGATIMASIIGLIDIATLKSAWQRDRLDGASFLAAFVGVLIFGLNTGLVIGLMVSFASLIWQSSKPHVAIVGQLGGTGHFRNINRHDVVTFDNLLMLRIDESLFFGNSESVHRRILNAMQQYPAAQEIILIMAAVNHIDLTAQEMLSTLNKELALQNKRLHFSFIKGPVMDIIGQTPLISELSGQVYLSTLDAVDALKDI